METIVECKCMPDATEYSNNAIIIVCTMLKLDLSCSVKICL